MSLLDQVKSVFASKRAEKSAEFAGNAKTLLAKLGQGEIADEIISDFTKRYYGDDPDADRMSGEPGDWQVYREILARSESPQRGDADALAELMVTLNLTTEDVAIHVDIINRLRSDLPPALAHAHLENQRQIAKERLEKAEADHKKHLEEVVDPAFAFFEDAQKRATNAAAARQRVSELIAKHPHLIPEALVK